MNALKPNYLLCTKSDVLTRFKAAGLELADLRTSNEAEEAYRRWQGVVRLWADTDVMKAYIETHVRGVCIEGTAERRTALVVTFGIVEED